MALMQTFIDADVEQKRRERTRFNRSFTLVAYLFIPLVFMIGFPIVAGIWAVLGMLVFGLIAFVFYPLSGLVQLGMWTGYYLLTCYGFYLASRRRVHR